MELQAIAHAIVNSPEWIELDIECLEAEIEDLYSTIIVKRNELVALRVKLAEAVQR